MDSLKFPEYPWSLTNLCYTLMIKCLISVWSSALDVINSVEAVCWCYSSEKGWVFLCCSCVSCSFLDNSNLCSCPQSSFRFNVPLSSETILYETEVLKFNHHIESTNWNVALTQQIKQQIKCSPLTSFFVRWEVNNSHIMSHLRLWEGWTVRVWL